VIASIASSSSETTAAVSAVFSISLLLWRGGGGHSFS